MEPVKKIDIPSITTMYRIPHNDGPAMIQDHHEKINDITRAIIALHVKLNEVIHQLNVLVAERRHDTK